MSRTVECMGGPFHGRRVTARSRYAVFPQVDWQNGGLVQATYEILGDVAFYVGGGVEMPPAESDAWDDEGEGWKR